MKNKFLGRSYFNSSHRTDHEYGIKHSNIINLRQQPLFNRNYDLIGYMNSSYLTCPQVVKSNAGNKWHSAACSDLRVHNVLYQVFVHCMRNPISMGKVKIKQFISFEKIILANFCVVDEIIECAVAIQRYGYEIVVEVEPLSPGNRALFDQYIDALSRFKEWGVTVVISDYNFKVANFLELEISFCDLIKINVIDLSIPLQAEVEFVGGVYSSLYKSLSAMSSKYGVPLIANGIETDWQAMIVFGLPFTYFQGCFSGFYSNA